MLTDSHALNPLYQTSADVVLIRIYTETQNMQSTRDNINPLFSLFYFFYIYIEIEIEKRNVRGRTKIWARLTEVLQT